MRASTPLLETRALAEPAILFDEGAEDTIARGLPPSRVSPSLLDLLGVRPTIGRGFTIEAASAEKPFSALRVEGQGWGLFGIRPADPLSVAAAAGALFVVAAAGAWFPAGRAAAIDPADALKAV